MRIKLIMIIFFGLFQINIASGAAAWTTGKITQVGIDFRGGIPANGGQLFVYSVGSVSGQYNLKWIADTYPNWWPYIYGMIMDAYNKGLTVVFEYDDATMEVRYIQLKEITP